MKKTVFILLTLVFMMILAFTVSAADISVEANDGRIFESAENENNFYLPSYISPSAVKLVFSGSKTITYTRNNEIVTVKSGDTVDLTPYMTDLGEGNCIYLLKLKVNGSTKSFGFRFANNLPSVHIDTSIGRDNLLSTNGKDEQAKATIVNNDGSYEYIDDKFSFSEFKVRGNTTDSYAKKPFQLKLDKKTDLFGMGSGKTWILLANYLDQSQIRNSVMYQIGKLLGMDTSSFKSVDLYIDGQYYGIFLLCEKVQISSTRVNIFEMEKLNDKLNPSYSNNSALAGAIPDTIITQYAYTPGVVNPDDITGGYLIELDNNYWENEKCYFVTQNDNHYVIKSPEYASKEQVEYIAKLFSEMEEAIMSKSGYNRYGKYYTEYMDVDSFVYAYIVAEFSRNYDAGSSSMYFYKDIDKNGEQSKIVKGPLWDCDNTLGNIHKNDASNTEGYWAKNRSPWVGLTKHADFNALVTREFARVYDEIFDMIDVGGFIYQQVEELGSSIHMERARWKSNDYSNWPLYFDGIHYDRWQSSPVFNFVGGDYSANLDKDSNTVIGYLCEHIEKRANWLANDWGCDVTIRERSFEIKEPLPNPDDTPSSTPDDTQDSTVDSLPNDTPSSVPDDTQDSTVDSVPDGTQDSTVDSMPNDTPSSVPDDTQDSTAESTPTSTVDSTNNNSNNENGNSSNDNTLVIVAIISLSVVALAGIITAIVLGIKLKSKM